MMALQVTSACKLMVSQTHDMVSAAAVRDTARRAASRLLSVLHAYV